MEMARRGVVWAAAEAEVGVAVLVLLALLRYSLLEPPPLLGEPLHVIGARRGGSPLEALAFACSAAVQHSKTRWLLYCLHTSTTSPLDRNRPAPL